MGARGGALVRTQWPLCLSRLIEETEECSAVAATSRIVQELAWAITAAGILTPTLTQGAQYEHCRVTAAVIGRLSSVGSGAAADDKE